MTAILCLLLLADPSDQAVPLHLDAITERDAARLSGQTVLVWLEVGKPSFTWEGGTVVAPVDQDDGVERTVVFGREVDAEPGMRLLVVGTLMLIRHPESVVGGVRVPAWVEIRVEEDGR